MLLLPFSQNTNLCCGRNTVWNSPAGLIEWLPKWTEYVMERFGVSFLIVSYISLRNLKMDRLTFLYAPILYHRSVRMHLHLLRKRPMKRISLHFFQYNITRTRPVIVEKHLERCGCASIMNILHITRLSLFYLFLVSCNTTRICLFQKKIQTKAWTKSIFSMKVERL